MNRIFIGYDQREAEAYHVLCHSIIKHARQPVQITPLKLELLPMWRERNPYQSTDFSFSRFLTPYLAGYEGWALFMDCDMLVTRDIAELFQYADERYAVMVVQHDYETEHETKFFGQNNPHYPRKNWSSLMLMNCAQCRALTPRFVNTASGLDLHRFQWLADEQIGQLPIQFNYLVGEYHHYPEGLGHKPPAILHYTIGTPCIREYRNCEWSTLWHQYKAEMLGGPKVEDTDVLSWKLREGKGEAVNA